MSDKDFKGGRVDHNPLGFICYFDVISDSEIDLVYDYWLLAGGGRRFVKSVRELCRVSGCSSLYLTRLIRKTAFYSLSGATICRSCHTNILVQNRKQYQNWCNGKSKVCSVCYENNLAAAIRHEEGYVGGISASPILRERKFSYGDIGYLDKFFLLFLLSSNVAHKTVFRNPLKNLELIGVPKSDADVLRRLVSLEALQEVGEVHDELHSSRKRLVALKTIVGINPKGRSNISEGEELESGFHLVLPEGYSSFYYYFVDLERDIKCGSIVHEDVVDISEVVKSIMVRDLNLLIDLVEIDNRISIARGVKLEFLLGELAGYISLEKCYYVLDKLAKDSVLYIHKNRINKTFSSRVYAKFLENYLVSIKKRGVGSVYPKSLGGYIDSSDLESMITSLFLEGCLNWHELSSREVVRFWVSSLQLEGG